MQGQRGTISSMQETLNIDHGSTTSNAAIDQQICWTNIHSRAEDRFPDCMLSNGTNPAFINPVNHEQQNFNKWSLGEGSSSGTNNEANHEELKPELGWSPSVNVLAGAGPRLDERPYGPANIISLDNGNVNPPFVQDTNFDAIQQNININASYVNPGGQETEHMNMHKHSGSKRKALDGHVGPSSSSIDGSSGYLQHPWSGSSSLNISGSSSEQVNPRLGLRVTSESNPDSVVTQNSHRNHRARLNPSNQQESSFPPLFSMSRNNAPFDRNSLDVNNTPPLVHNTQPVIVHPPPVLPQNAQPFQWGPQSRIEASRRTMLEQHPMFTASSSELRSLVRTRASRNLAAANNTTARTGSTAPAPGWVPHPSSSSSSSSQHQRRISELVRRSLLSSTPPPGTDSVGGGGESNNQSAPVNPEEIVFSSSRRHHHVFPRSASWIERHGGADGIHQSLRNLTASSEGRSRLVVSEIRNVLDLMRRGEGLRIEDVMVLDQSMYFGMADIHDRHRDMRLDVDNMSYEELLALEERIGNVNTGLTEENISTKLKKNRRCIVKGAEQETEPCCVCQEEYNDGEDLGVLDCGHEFHTQCINKWLTHKNICPICKETGLKM